MRRLLVGAVLAVVAPPAFAQDAALAPANGPAPAYSAAAAPGEMVLVLGQIATRMTVPVHILPGQDGQATEGPWPFIVDTGSERTVVTRQLAGRLGLAAGPAVKVIAMSGTTVVPTVVVPKLAVSTLARHAVTAPALEAEHVGAAGLVGIDALQDHAVVIDFDRDRMTVAPSGRRRRAPARAGDVVVAAKSRFGQLIVTDAGWRGRRIAVVIDTGTPISVGNPALMRMLNARRGDRSMTMVSVTGGVMTAAVQAVDGLEVGGLRFSDAEVAIADAAPFHRFGLTDTPALLMGMDLLRLFRTVRIDFANREIRFAMPRGMQGPNAKGI